MAMHESVNEAPNFFTRIQPQVHGTNQPFIAREALDFPPGRGRKVPHILGITGDAKDLLLSIVEGPPDSVTLNIEELLYSGNSDYVLSLLSERRAFVSAGHWFRLLERGGTTGETVWAGGKPLHTFMRAGVTPFAVRARWVSDMRDNRLSGFTIEAYLLNLSKQWMCTDEFITYQP